jgi:hypothetical protein
LKEGEMVKYTASDDRVKVDNRDAGTTELHLPNGDTVEVDPWYLLENVIENLTVGTPEQRKEIHERFQGLMTMVDGLED